MPDGSQIIINKNCITVITPAKFEMKAEEGKKHLNVMRSSQ